MTHLNSNTTDHQAFPARLLAISTLQILANSTQFTSLRPVSLDTLTHVASRYLQLLAEAARAYADHSGRTHINAWDLSGVLESLQGKGALSGLHNWCIDNLEPSLDPIEPYPDLNSIPDESLKLATLAKHLPSRPATSPRLEPITSLSFLPLTDAEVAALDRAGETDLEEDQSPSPHASSTSASSEDDSDYDLDHLLKPNIESVNMDLPEIPPMPEKAVCENLVERWRSVDEIPCFVPAYFPPLPGLERVVVDVPTDELGEEMQIENQPQPEPEREPSPTAQPTTKHDPYLSATPYAKSQLFEQHGPSALPILSTSPPPSDSCSPPARKRARRTEALECFEETYAFVLDEARSPELLKPNARRLALLSRAPVEPLSDSLFGSLPVSSLRPTRWTAGWIPHPPTVHVGSDILLPTPELKPFGHAPLPIPLTQPVPLDLPPSPIAPPPHSRLPSLIPSIFRSLPDSFTLINRLTRLGPPCELGQSGEPTAYRIKESLNNKPNEIDNNSIKQPKYMEWGFHWPSHHGHEPLPKPYEPSQFIPAPFPSMPKTTAEKARLAKLNNEQRDEVQMSNSRIEIIGQSSEKPDGE
ncbi:hypothetical protein CROQUDRAFT_716983 [Cronartium quercuum f. sp. fusiforme G11]|uniref:Bromodomain associated domain-containing protein n=1 Tax=Cronartium quercuum f. sp. fusiforme G11 TaxID=708437 RepID=A0A9P6T941_9BASI|nr:hypothetical protein CROQUDRAFT_716983 [Cronartium quercuum f. sp. fusiforme G11]